MKVLLLCLVVAAASAVPNRTPCPLLAEEYTVADTKQCDKFHVCTKGFISASFLCQDGLIFDGHRCSLPYNINCGTRSLLQKPQPKGRCPRLNGNFPVEGTCNSYIFCQAGIERFVECPGFLVFDPKTGVCSHADAANREGCTAERQYDFECPIKSGHHTFPAPGDCRAFFTCQFPSYRPHLGGCSYGLVFNEKTQRCDEPKNVAGCENYYNEEQ
jgi:hypothetical protein